MLRLLILVLAVIGAAFLLARYGFHINLAIQHNGKTWTL